MVGRDSTDLSWLPLLQVLTDALPSWAVLKNVDAALAGRGDIDSFVDKSFWPAAVDAIANWASHHQVQPTVVCTHVPGLCSTVSLSPDGRGLLQFDVFDRLSFRGGVVFTAETGRLLAEIDERGFRRLRPAAEGLLLLFFNGVTRTGGLDSRAVEAKRIRQLLRSDLGGVAKTAAILRLPVAETVGLAEAVVSGRWARSSALSLQAKMSIRATTDVPFALQRLRFRVRGLCPVGRALANDRQAPQDLAKWLSDARRSGDAVLE